MACIYQIKNLINNKIYIGSTQKEYSLSRKHEHFSQLRGNYHFNIHLQRAWNKYGEENFEFEILEEFKFPIYYNNDYKYEYILCREIYYINKLNSNYNINKEISGGKLGRKRSEREKQYLSNLFKNRVVSEETKNKIKKARARQVITEETKRKISIANKGNKGPIGFKQSEKQKTDSGILLKKQAKFKIGPHSQEAKEKRTNTLKKIFNTPEMKNKFKFSARNRNRKLFVCRKDNKLIGKFTSQIEASEELGFNKPWGISAVLNGLQKTHKGYTFEYKNI